MLPPRVLLVDDDPSNLHVAGTILRGNGWLTVEAEGGDAAIASMKGERFALVLLDIQMPVLDGYATARAMRAEDGRNRYVPILAFTALRADGLAAGVRAAGMDGIVAKPFTPDSLLASVMPWRPPSALPGNRLAAIFGEAEMKRLLDGLRTQLGDALVAIDQPDLRERIAHKLAGISGTLGFPEVSRLWLALSEGDAAVIEEARSAARRLIVWLDEAG